MKARITVCYRGLVPSEDVHGEIALQAQRLERVDADIVRWHVSVERCDEGEGEHYRVDLHVTLQGGDIVASHMVQDGQPPSDIQEALRLAFDDVAEQLAASRLLRFQPRRRGRGAAPGW